MRECEVCLEEGFTVYTLPLGKGWEEDLERTRWSLETRNLIKVHLGVKGRRKLPEWHRGQFHRRRDFVVSVEKRPKSPLSKDFSSTVGKSDLFGVVSLRLSRVLSCLIHPSVLPE